jgi:cytidylate kinase
MADLAEVSTDALMREVQRRLDCQSKPDKRVILVGPPGCGKGTQSPKIKNEHCLCHLATGDMLRAAVAAKTPNGVRAKNAMEAGAHINSLTSQLNMSTFGKHPMLKLGPRVAGCTTLRDTRARTRAKVRVMRGAVARGSK